MIIDSYDPRGAPFPVNLDDKEDYYPHNFSYAREHGELREFFSSHRLDRECADLIDKALSENFDGSTLNADGALRTVLLKFCPERISRVLSETVLYACPEDGRYRKDNSSWAESVNPEQPPGRYEDHICILKSHPGVLDEFIRDYRKELSLINRTVEDLDEILKEKAEKYTR